MKALVGAFNQEKALVGVFSVIVQLHRLIDYTALVQIQETDDSSVPAHAVHCSALHRHLVRSASCAVERGPRLTAAADTKRSPGPGSRGGMKE